MSRGGWISLFRGLCLLVDELPWMSLLPWISLPVDELLDEEAGS